MEEKNRFSRLLEQLMSEAEIKNYTLAQELQYDVSYISKWISGRMLPAEKTERKVLSGISHCIVSAASEEGLANLRADYNIELNDQLEMAIYDHLAAEYNYVREQEKNPDASIGEKTYYYPELSMAQYLAKMQHPVLRRVKSLKVIALIDLMALDNESRARFVTMEGNRVEMDHDYPDVHFSVIMNIVMRKWDFIYDTLFLIHTLAVSQHIDFKLYGSKRAYGRAIFVVKNDFMISGMLDGDNRCISVVVSEDSKNCSSIYESMGRLLTHEALLFQKASIQDMLEEHIYMYLLLATQQRWLMGHPTEHFLPDDLFDQLLEQAAAKDAGIMQNQDALRNLHRLNQRVLRSAKVQIMIYESSFSEWVVSDAMDFYDCRVTLTAEQKCRCLNHFLTMCQEHENLTVKMVHGAFAPDLILEDRQSIFLSDKGTYLRLDSGRNRYQMMLVTRADMQCILEKFFSAIWELRKDVVVSDWEKIRNSILHTVQMIEMVADME
ncbi:MAG: hypothetical protein LUF28_05920 [Clostridiales bacterium]|nr:hypothetical protein [Clostridiales bacterium]